MAARTSIDTHIYSLTNKGAKWLTDLSRSIEHLPDPVVYKVLYDNSDRHITLLILEHLDSEGPDTFIGTRRFIFGPHFAHIVPKNINFLAVWESAITRKLIE